MGQILDFWLNYKEFGDIYIRPLYFGIIGGTILAMVSFVRIDIKNRRSIIWWLLDIVIQVVRKPNDFDNPKINIQDFRNFSLTPGKFVLWQLTKLIIISTFFLNMNVGMALSGMSQGWQSGLSHIPKLLLFPFITPTPGFAEQNVIPMIPALTLIVYPLLNSLGTRLVILVGLTQLLKGMSSTIIEFGGELRTGNDKFGVGPDLSQIKLPISTIEALIALFLFWTGFNLFFPSYIDYNSKFIIGGFFAAGIAFSIFSYLDSPKTKRLFKPSRINSIRIGSLLLIGLLVGSAIAVQGSIADARKVEWNGPYTDQEIAVNRYLANLGNVDEIPYNFSLTPLSRDEIRPYIDENAELLDKIRLWDLAGADAKLKPEIGLIPYVDFQDTDILRFNGSLYWSSSMKPILPDTVEAANVWYNQHLVYTHVPNGFLLLDGHDGKIVDTQDFFDQRKIYYGEGGLFSETWSAYPSARESSDELNNYMYSGSGGIDISPPLSWLFEPNFLLARPFETIHAMRYKDVHERMELLFPYFVYNIDGRPIDMYPVTDGKETYWLMPLITALDTSNVPWSDGNFFVRHVGYSLINTYDGNISLYILGDDYYSDLFKTLYPDYIEKDIPEWLKEQTRYPEELFNYRVNMYNFYHITDSATFIEAREFFEVPPNLDTYFILAKPPGFVENEFLGLISLQLRGSPGQNLAGYMVVRNNFENLGEMIFYEVPLDATTKLLGPTAILEALERNPDFATLRTLLRNPRVGDNILYRVGDHDVYFIPVYTAGAGGVVTNLGTVAAIGAAFDGEYYVGFGDTPEEAFEQFLLELSGVSVKQLPDPEPKPGPEPEIVRPDIIREGINEQILDIFSDNGISVVTPEEIPSLFKFKEFQLGEDADSETVQSVVDDFINTWMKSFDVTRIYYWTDGNSVNYGAVINVNGVSELHYITILK
ncbi:MAG: hypothetical protein CMO11_03680 [Thaumarchaeota archaeon]|nr:hypothetical protein [Nitrososphaerota archaeon]